MKSLFWSFHRKNAKDCKEKLDAKEEAVKKALVSSLVSKCQLEEKEVEFCIFFVFFVNFSCIFFRTAGSGSVRRVLPTERKWGNFQREVS